MKRKEFTGEDLLKRKHFDDLIKTIVQMTTDDEGEETKDGLRLAIGYILKRLIKVFNGYYIQQDRMDDAKEVDLFQRVFESNWAYTFHSSQVATELLRNTLRKPCDMPLESDIKKSSRFSH
ncbi:hypothetical protein ElyMa_005674100 [Elysia marginata]|uniref:Uncharacterized protein n=1 Tax=Elysia marginata TaxID=1093978 RepID=A0AAV4FEZ1_9GAST|nr:hypothetical protein ElyMa_005674100 [Elysia marginata]